MDIIYGAVKAISVHLMPQLQCKPALPKQAVIRKRYLQEWNMETHQEVTMQVGTIPTTKMRLYSFPSWNHQYMTEVHLVFCLSKQLRTRKLLTMTLMFCSIIEENGAIDATSTNLVTVNCIMQAQPWYLLNYPYVRNSNGKCYE